MADNETTETTGAGAPLTPKERRQAKRARQVAKRKARGTLTPEQRQAERDAERKRKAAERRRRRVKERAARKGAERTEPLSGPEHGPGTPKRLQGVVVSDRAEKTIVVRVDEARRHPRYRKILRTSMKVHAHDETNNAHIGDTVRVQECRPLSRTKRWRLVDVLERAK